MEYTAQCLTKRAKIIILTPTFYILGSFSDRSDEREEYNIEIEKIFGGKGNEEIDMNAQDGTFFMRYKYQEHSFFSGRYLCTHSLTHSHTLTHTHTHSHSHTH